MPYRPWPPDQSPVERPLVGQRLEGGDDDVMPIHLEEAAQRGAGVAAAEASVPKVT